MYINKGSEKIGIGYIRDAAVVEYEKRLVRVREQHT